MLRGGVCSMTDDNIMQKVADQDSDSSEIISEPDSESDYVPPSSHSLTHSEEMIVNKVTRIGLVATNKCPSVILTDRVEMEAIRKSLGMLPRKSGITETYDVVSGDEVNNTTSSGTYEQRSQTEKYNNQPKTEEWSEFTSNTSNSRESVRSEQSVNDIKNSSTYSPRDRRYSHRNEKMIEHRKQSVESKSRTCDREWSVERCCSDNTTNYRISDKSRQMFHRKCCACSYSTWCVSMNKTLLNDRLITDRQGERCCHAVEHDNMMMCCVCQDQLQWQHRTKHCSQRINCFEANRNKFYNTSLYHTSHPQRGDYNSVYGKHHGSVYSVTTHLSTLQPTHHLSEHQGSYFQQYIRKKKEKKQGCKYPVKLPSLKLPTTSNMILQTQHDSYSIAYTLKRSHYASHGRPPAQLPHPVLGGELVATPTNYYQIKRMKDNIYDPKSYAKLYYKR